MHTRRAALAILNQVDEGSAFSSKLLSSYSNNQKVIFPLLQKLVKGTLSWRERIDETLRGIIPEKEASALKKDWNILRLAAYQFLYLDEVPVPLVLKESSGLASSQNNARRITSILGNLLHDKTTRKNIPDAKGSHPAWILAEWEEAFGKSETAKLCAANNVRWPVSIRANTLLASPSQVEKFLRRERVKIRSSQYVRGCFIVESLPKDCRLHELESFQKGLFQVQDESASVVGMLLNPRPGETIVDLCAAPGGKTTHLAALMRNQGRIIAVDVHESALLKLKDNCKKLGVKIVRTTHADGASLALPFKVDAVVVDAPCSGLGVLGRKVDIRWAKSKEQIPELAELQLRLLLHAATLLKSGGRMTYSTCTLHRDENQKVIQAFLKQRPDFKVLRAQEQGFGKLATNEGYILTLPHKHGMGGGFAVLLQHQKVEEA
jgi:16S rRNA (cytosine967-C5)-methyltransferase